MEIAVRGTGPRRRGDEALGGAGSRSDVARMRELDVVGAVVGSAIAAAADGDPKPLHIFHVLWMAEQDDDLRPRQISAATNLSSAGTSGLIDRMEQRGLVRRETGSTSDLRAVTIIITATGSAMLDAMLDGFDPLVGRLAKALFPV